MPAADRPPPFLRSLGHALAGITDLLRSQRNARIHLVATVLMIGLGLYAGLGRIDWALLAVAAGLVWVAEAVNTALERLGDAVTREQHPLIGRAKDLAAGAVLIAAGVAVVIGALVLLPALIARIAG